MSPQMFFKDVSPAAITLDYGPSGHANLTLDAFLGAVRAKKDDQIVDVFEEGYGDAPVDAVAKGSIVTIEAPLTRITPHEWALLFPNAIEIQSADELIWKNLVGYDFFANSTNLVIRPLINNIPSAVPNEWLYYFHVHPFESWDVGFDREEQRVIMVNFKVFPVQSGAAKGRLFKRGV